MDFTAKRVLVTAGANGIGLAIANKFRELGATVFVTDIDADAVEKARVNGFAAAVSDVSDEEQVRALMATVNQELGGLGSLMEVAAAAAASVSSARRTVCTWLALSPSCRPTQNSMAVSSAAGSRLVTNVPAPCRVSRMPIVDSARTPSRSEPRDTCNSAARSFSMGRRSPGLSLRVESMSLTPEMTTSVWDIGRLAIRSAFLES